jgi:hypothetical protein
MHIFLVAAEREILAKFLKIPSEAQHRRRIPIMCSVREGNIAQFILNASTVESPRSGDLR